MGDATRKWRAWGQLSGLLGHCPPPKHAARCSLIAGHRAFNFTMTKEGLRDYHREYRRTHPVLRLREKLRGKRRRAENEGRAQERERKRKWRATQSGKVAIKREFEKLKSTEAGRLVIRARSILNQAIKSGKVIRMPCVVCGDPKSQGHHPDYNKPLEVDWLCALHHKQEHERTNNE